MNTIAMVKKQLKLQKSPADAGISAVLQPGVKALITQSNNKKWCKVINSEGGEDGSRSAGSA